MACKSKKYFIESGKINCAKCGRGLINSIINKLPVELHLPGHNFAGPGTQLLWGKTRLNPDLTFKEWSKPIDQDDEIAYRHDVCFLKNKDTKTRNEVCDKNMLKQLNEMKNPTFSEKAHRLIIKPIIWSKQKMGMGDYFSYINKKMKIYCVKCKEKTDTKDYHETITKNGKPIGKGNCLKCGTKKNVFLPT